MASATNQQQTLPDLQEVDTEHLASQALKLFSRRYGHLYDGHLQQRDTTNKGYVTYDELYESLVQVQVPCDAKRTQIIETLWIVCSGGYTHTEVTQLDRQKLIELCIKGYQSKDAQWVRRLVDAITTINRYNFDSIDTNHDGNISEEEFLTYFEKRGDKQKWQECFRATDLNGDGHIDRGEWLKCNLGFFFNIDEERYNHFFGYLKD